MRLRTTPLAALALVATTAFAGPIETNDNAALRYWRAFSMLSEKDTEMIQTLSDAQEARGHAWLDNEEHASWIESKNGAITLLTESSLMEEADFGIDYDKGIEALLTHLAPMRTSARLVLLQARADLRAGEVSSAIGRIATALRMAEHITDDRVLISSLVSVSILNAAGEVIRDAKESGALVNHDLTPLREAFERFDREDPFAILDAIEAERDIFGAWLHRTLASKPAEERARYVLEKLDIKEESLDAKGRAALATIKTDEGLDRQMSLYNLYFERVRVAWDEPDAEDRLRELERGIAEGVFGHVAKQIAPSFVKVRAQDERARSSYSELQEIIGG